VSTASLLPFISPGDGVIDLGANTGSYTKAFAKAVGPEGCVLAVEPDPVSCDRLRDVAKAYPCVVIRDVAVWSRDREWAPLAIDGEDRRRNSLWPANVIHGDGTTPVELFTLDVLAASVPKLKAIKMDVQGAECHVLDGAASTLSRELVWCVELWPEGLTHAGRSFLELLDQFAAAGYQPQTFTRERLIEILSCYDGHKSTDVVFRKC
jgi:FkbM family methyltransferase